jgi:anti-sigma factor RsiW
MRDCRALREHLKAYIDGELPTTARLTVRRHLAGCAACREEVTAMERIGSELRAGEAAATLDPGLRARILSEAPDTAAAPAARPLRRPLAIWGAAAAAAFGWFVLVPVARNVATPASMAPTASMRQSMPSPPAGGDAAMRAPAAPAAETAPTVAGSAPALGPGGVHFSSRMHESVAKDGWRSGPGRAPAAAALTAGSTAGRRLPPAERQVVRSAEMTLAVVDLEARSERVEQMTRESGGFVAGNQLTTGEGGMKTAYLVLRVPSARFDGFLRDLARMGEVRAKNVTGEDVTERVVDENAAEQVLREEARRAQAAVRAAGAGQGWAEQETARQARIRHRQAQDRLELLKRSAALATITLQLHEKERTAIQGGGFLAEMGDTGRAAVNSFLAAARVPVLALIWVVAYAPVWVPLALAYRYAAKLQRRRAAVREARQWQAKWSQSPAPEGEPAG